ncbi:hypothetical protein Vafri_15083 [Volvox africanus]|nr:hypothetical protein Vafri_15083 [Volvox africanus]
MLEGGGQILRNASALAAITGIPLTVDQIRAKRTKPGLQPQHLTGLKLVEALCCGKLDGGEVGSSRIVLRPQQSPRTGKYSADTRTAGSCTLMLQAAMPVCVFAGPALSLEPGGDPGFGQLELKGGTDADMAPPVGYLIEVLIPLLRNRYGNLLDGLDVQLVRRGFYPRGGGILMVRVPSLPAGTSLPPLNLTSRGNLTQVTIKAFSAGRVAVSVAKRLAASAEAAVRRTLKGLGPMGRGVPVLVEVVYETPDRAVGDGCGVLVFADTDTGCRLGASAKGERGVPAEAIGERAAAELTEALTSGTCVDQWMQDQLIIWMALGSGTSRIRCTEPTLHTRTAMVVAEQLLPGVKFRLYRPRGHKTEDTQPLSAPAPAGPDSGDGSGAVVRQGDDSGDPWVSDGGGGYDDSGLWLIECTGSGWAVGKNLDGKA